MSGEHNFDEEEALAAGGHAEFMDLNSGGGNGSGGGGVLLPMEGGGEEVDHGDVEDPHTNHDGATSPVHHAPDEETPDDAEIAEHIAAAVEQELAGPLRDHHSHHQQQLQQFQDRVENDGGGLDHEEAVHDHDGMPAPGQEDDDDLAPAVVEEPMHSSSGEKGACQHHQHQQQQQQQLQQEEETRPHHSLYEAQEDLEEDSDGGGGEQQHQELNTSPSTMIVHPDSLPMSIPAPVATAIFDPSSPGKVVDTGREHTGRWTKEEHEAFLSALQMYGKEWKKVAAKVKTRTVVQTRTHAQKYFQKLQKSIDSGGTMDISMGMYDMEESGPSRKSNTSSKKKSKAMSIATPMKLTRRSSQTTMSAAHVISTLSSAKPSFVSAGSSTTFDPTTPSFVGMKIIAPDPTAMSKFPEPSPAATGKRKLAELAAAQMLVGVGGSGDSEFGSERKKPSVPYPPPLQIVNPESLRASYKTATGDSPSTPWESDLLTLVNEKNRRSARAPSSVSAKIRSIVTGSSHVNPVNGPPSSYGRSPLHQAVCRGDRSTLQTLLADLTATEDQQANDKVNELNMIDEAGFAPLHSACAKFLPQIDQPTGQRNDLVRMLLEAGADVAVTDRNGNTPLHWASRTGDTDAATELLSRHAPVDAINGNEETPLHWAMRTGMRGTKIVAILLANRARPSSLNYLFRRPMDVAAEGFDDQEGSVAWYHIHPDKKNRDYKKIHRMTTSERRDTRMNLFIRSDHSRTLLLHHPECLEHRARNDTDWESPDRITAILDGVKAPSICKHEVSVTSDFEKANLDLLSRVHSAEYLSFVSNLSKDLEKKVKAAGTFDLEAAASSVCVPFTPMVQRTMIQVEESEIKDSSDTSFSVGSLNAARRAAGAVQHAVNCVLVGRNRNAFCLVRPPGHHAGINGLLEGGESCGFCIFNNVAAGALHAIADDKLSCNRCAIVDIDVHHGNGTEEIVRRFNDPSKLFFFSIHLFDNDRKTKPGSQSTYKFYPGTGDEDELALNIINVPIVPLWKDPTPTEPVGKTHNTRKKAKADYGSLKTDGLPLEGAEGVDYSFDAAVAVAAETVAVPNDASPVYTGRQAYRQAIQNRLLPALRAFDPDLIMISAGFDACKGDVGNARHERGGEKIGLDLEPDDYAWTTRRILEIADICCQGRVVSVLEGGYGRSAQKGLDRTGFGMAAIQHLHSLIDPYDSETRFTNP